MRRQIIGVGDEINPLVPSTDKGDADVALVAGKNHTVQMFETALTANRTVTVSKDAKRGDIFRIVRSGLGAFTLTVTDGVAIKVMPANTAAWCEIAFEASSLRWKLIGYGLL
jgi:hypothetical protein